MDRSAVTWVGLAVVALVFLDLLFVEVRRIVREAKRIASRLHGYTELPVFSLMAAAGSDVERINSAADEIPLLIGRGQRAIAVLRGYLPKGSSPE
jgi:hypothetical protein